MPFIELVYFCLHLTRRIYQLVLLPAHTQWIQCLFFKKGHAARYNFINFIHLHEITTQTDRQTNTTFISTCD